MRQLGDPSKASFDIGVTIFNSPEKILKSVALARIANRLASTSGPLPSAANILLMSCATGGTQNKGVDLLKALAKKMHAVVFGAQDCTRASVNQFNDTTVYRGKWTMAYEQGINVVSKEVLNAAVDSFGKIIYEDIKK